MIFTTTSVPMRTEVLGKKCPATRKKLTSSVMLLLYRLVTIRRAIWSALGAGNLGAQATLPAWSERQDSLRIGPPVNRVSEYPWSSRPVLLATHFETSVSILTTGSPTELTRRRTSRCGNGISILCSRKDRSIAKFTLLRMIV